MKFDDIKRESARYGEFALKEVAYTAENATSRLAGSVAEADAAEYAAKVLSETGAKVDTEAFKVAPAAAYGWFSVTMVCILLAYVAYFFVSMVSVALIVVALLPLIIQGIFLSRAFDGAYISRTSHNVTALLPCTGEVKKRVFFTSHLDSAHVFRPGIKGGAKAALALDIVSAIGCLYLFAADIARWAYLGSVGTGLAADEWLIVGLVGIVFVPIWATVLFLIDGKRSTPGAGDGLSGCFVAAAVLKALAESDVKPEHTEVGVILTGSSECGLRGAKAWCDAHAEEYRDGKTYFVTLDSLRDENKLKVRDRDMNGLKQSDKELVSLFKNAAARADLKCGKDNVCFGSTDAAAFGSAGLKAVGVTAFDTMGDVYHTEKDCADSLNGDFMSKCFRAAVELIEMLDNEE